MGASVTISKKRYAELARALEQAHGPELAESMLGTLKEVLNFDPDASAYTARAQESIRTWRAKKAEEAKATGTSVRALLRSGKEARRAGASA